MMISLRRYDFDDDKGAAPMLDREKEALHFLLPLSADYPGIDAWFAQKVVPGLRCGTRKLICVEREGKIVGVGIGKDDLTEKKICTVRIAPSHVGRGIGLRLFDQLLHWLNVDQPHLTVSERTAPRFERIFDHYGFRLTSGHQDRYITGVTELAYNERDAMGRWLTHSRPVEIPHHQA